MMSLAMCIACLALICIFPVGALILAGVIALLALGVAIGKRL